MLLRSVRGMFVDFAMLQVDLVVPLLYMKDSTGRLLLKWVYLL